MFDCQSKTFQRNSTNSTCDLENWGISFLLCSWKTSSFLVCRTISPARTSELLNRFIFHKRRSKLVKATGPNWCPKVFAIFPLGVTHPTALKTDGDSGPASRCSAAPPSPPAPVCRRHDQHKLFPSMAVAVSRSESKHGSRCFWSHPGVQRSRAHKGIRIFTSVRGW